MTTFKIIVSAAILLGSVTAGVFIIGRNALDRGTARGNPATHDQSRASAPEATPLFEELPDYENDKPGLGAETFESPDAANEEPTRLSENNETRQFAQTIARQIAEQTPDGSSLAGGRIDFKNIDTEAVAASLVENFTATDYEKFLSPVFLDEIKTVPAGGAETYRVFFSALDKAVKRNVAGVNLDPENLDLEGLAAMESAIGRIVSELLLIPAPAPLAELHRRQIELVGAQKNIFSAFKDVENDPVRAFGAYRALPLVSKELAVVRAEFIGFLNREKISL